MRGFHLPDDLERIERLLVRGPGEAPSAGFRQRVLDGVRSELGRLRPALVCAKPGLPPALLDGLRRRRERERQRAKWQLAACFAATAVVAAVLTLGMLQATGFAQHQSGLTPTLSDIAWQIQQISPQVSLRDSQYQAKLRQIGDEASCGTAINRLLAEFKSHDH